MLLQYFKLNIELFPSIANCYDSLAECFMTTGNYTESIKYYKMALDKLDADETLNENGRTAFRERVNEQLKNLNHFRTPKQLPIYLLLKPSLGDGFF